MEREVPASVAIDLIRRQRHSFLNHLQVISGWLQLNRPEKSRQYLEQVVSRMAGESEPLKALPPELGLVSLELSLEAETYGVRLDWVVPGGFEPGATPSPQEIRAQVSGAIRSAATLAEAERHLTISLAPEGVVSVHTPSDKGEG